MIRRLIAPNPPGGEAFVGTRGDGFEIVAGEAPDATLASPKGRAAKLKVVDIGSASVVIVPEGGRWLVYGDRFQPADLALLRTRQWSGIDRAGQLVVSSSDLVVTVERPSAPSRRPATAPATSLHRVRGWAFERKAAAVRGGATARLTQLLLERPQRRWRASDLAAEDGLATIATASRLLAELHELGLCSVVPQAQSRWYTILDSTLLLRWLAERTPPLNRRTTLDGYYRVGNVDALLDRVIGNLGRLSAPAVLTGSAAVLIEDRHLTTSVPLITVRVDPTLDLADAADRLELQPGGRGNVRLVSDRGYVGTAHHREVRLVPLAGIVRTWLDLRHERRGDDAAELYYGTVVDAIAPPSRTADG